MTNLTRTKNKPLKTKGSKRKVKRVIRNVYMITLKLISKILLMHYRASIENLVESYYEPTLKYVSQLIIYNIPTEVIELICILIPWVS